MCGHSAHECVHQAWNEKKNFTSISAIRNSKMPHLRQREKNGNERASHLNKIIGRRTHKKKHTKELNINRWNRQP